MTASQDLMSYLNSTPRDSISEYKVALWMKKLDHEQKMEQLQEIKTIVALFKSSR